jgi:hypothetical protein
MFIMSRDSQFHPDIVVVIETRDRYRELYASAYEQEQDGLVATWYSMKEIYNSNSTTKN